MGTGTQPAVALARPADVQTKAEVDGAAALAEARRFSQLHVEVVRNATGDFNPFHDARRWLQVRRNPFGAPIVLGFQLEAMLVHAVARRWAQDGVADDLPYLSCRFTFVDAVRINELVLPEVKPTRVAREQVANRVLLRKEGRAVVTGRVECHRRRPAALGIDFRPPPGLEEQPDGARLAGGRFFLKRRVLQVSDAKNFLAGSQVPVAPYFDELESRVRFPELYPLSLISSALLEKAAQSGYDFLERPLVYAAHNFHIDRALVAGLKDGALLHILVEEVQGTDSGAACRHRCIGLLNGGRLLFVADARLAPLPD